MWTANVFASGMAVICLLLLIAVWTLHADYEAGARRICLVMAVIVGLAAIGALIGPHWHA